MVALQFKLLFSLLNSFNKVREQVRTHHGETTVFFMGPTEKPRDYCSFLFYMDHNVYISCGSSDA